MNFTNEELRLILLGKKKLTIRQLKKNGSMPVTLGSEIYLKTGSYISKERYGKIKIIDVCVKPLKEMNFKDAYLGGYNNIKDYLEEQLNSFNKGVTLDTEMVFIEFKVLSINRELIKNLER